jgi:hypothetical protein
MKIRFQHRYQKVIPGLLLLLFAYSLILPYSLFIPISKQHEILAIDQLYPVLAISLANSFYIQSRETNLVQVNILAFAAEMVLFSFQNQIQVLQLNPPKFPTHPNHTFFLPSAFGVPLYLKKCLLRI